MLVGVYLSNASYAQATNLSTLALRIISLSSESDAEAKLKGLRKPRRTPQHTSCPYHR